MADMSRKAATLQKKKTRAFNDDETELLISEWIKYPCLYDKMNKDYHDKNKRDVAKNQIAESLNAALFDDEEPNPYIITGSYLKEFLF